MGLTRHVRGALVIALLLPATACAASDRFANPNGSGTACTLAAPCTLDTAVNMASANDDITIEPGTYNESTDLSDSGNFLTIHGEAGQPRPVIDTTATYGFALTGGSSLSDVEVNDPTAMAWGIDVNGGMEASISHVYVHTTGSGAWACYPDGELVNSVCWQSGPGGGAARPLVILSASVVMRNDPLIASGAGGVAAEVIAAGNTTMSMTLTNTIARGAGKDLYVTGNVVSGGSATITADHSNYAIAEDDVMESGTGTSSFTPAGTGTNETGSPVFVNAAAGNFRELGTSPTIDHGVEGALDGTTDLDGSPREVGAGVDIGAYEFVPAPTCDPINDATGFGVAKTIKLDCADVLHAGVTYAIATKPAHGTATLNAATGSVTYKPKAGFSGNDSFTYTATSSHGTATAALVSIAVASEPKPAISKFKRSGKTVSFTLSESANVTLTLTHKGHKVETVKRSFSAGKHKLKLPKKLKAGKYKVTLSASNAGGTAKPVPLRFKTTA
jgi:hypothetical protein